MSYVSSISGVVGLIPALFLVPLYKKFGNAGSGVLGSGFAVIIYIVMLITGIPSVSMYVVCVLLATLGANLLTAVIPQCLMDCVDYGEWKTGHKNTAIIMSANGIGQKIGLAFGTSVAGFVLGALQFDPNAATQPANVLNAFFHLTITGQLAVYGIMFVLMLYLAKIEKKLPEMKAEVMARRTAT